MKFLFSTLIVTIFISSNVYTQIDYSILTKKKISKSNLKSFAKLKFYKSHSDSECISGDCKNGFSSLKQSFKYRDGNNDKHIDCIYLVGNFKNGKLNGKGVIYVFNHTNTKGIDQQLKSGDYNLMANPKYTELIASDFKNNIASKGIYSFRSEDNYGGAAGCYHNKTVLVSSSNWSKQPKPLFAKHFKDVSVKAYLKPTLQVFYHGNFPNLKFRDNTEKGTNKEYSKIEINYFYINSYSSKKNNFIRYTLYPEADYKYHIVDYKVVSNNKIKEQNSFTVTLENGKCTNCDITNISDFAVNQDKRKKEKIEKERLEKYNKASRFLGQIIGTGTSHYYVNEIDDKGCAKMIPFPTKAYVLNFKDGVTRNQARKMIVYQPNVYSSCNLSYYNIKNATICSSCAGVGKVTLEDLTKYRKIVWEKGKDVIKHISKSDVACKTCAGLGVVKK